MPVKLRKAPEKQDAAMFVLAFGMAMLFVGGAGIVIFLTDPAGRLFSLFPLLSFGTGIVSVIVIAYAVRLNAVARGPVLLELTSEQLRDFRTGEFIKWKEVQSVQQCYSENNVKLRIGRCGREPILVLIGELDHTPGSITAMAIDLHRRANGIQSLQFDLHELNVKSNCPMCGRETESLKCYHFLFVVFLLVHAEVRFIEEIGCPSCTRKKVLWNLLINLPAANLLWPLTCLPWSLVMIVMSMTHGHSRSVLRKMAENISESGYESRAMD